MNLLQKRRCYFLSILLVGLLLATGLVLYALRQNINLFFTPTDIAIGKASKQVRIRVGGMVEKGSLIRKDNLAVTFMISDFSNKLEIHYQGILPDLFREGQGVVAMGRLQGNEKLFFVADEILAKHDENYMPPEILNNHKAVTELNKGSRK